MDHHEFVARARSNAILWGVKGFFRPVFLVWGIRGLLAVFAASLLVLAPTLGFALYCLSHQRYAAMLWLLPAILEFLAGTPNLNCVSFLLPIVWALTGLVLAFFFGQLHVVAGLLPGLTWLLSGAFKGTTMMSMEERLCASPESYKRLKESGRLKLLKWRVSP